MGSLKLSAQLLEDPTTSVFARPHLHIHAPTSKSNETASTAQGIRSKLSGFWKRMAGGEGLDLADEKR